MLFSKVKYYRLTKPLSLAENDLRRSLEPSLFRPIEKSQVSCQGFVNPQNLRSENPIHGVTDTFLLCLRIDSKSIPASTVKKKTLDRVRQLEKSKGDKASKEEKEDIKEQVTSEMVSSYPLDFVKSKHVYVLLMPNEDLIAINSASPGECELVLSMLRKVLGSLPVVEFEVGSMPSAVMTQWLKDESDVPDEIIILQEAQLRDELDEKGATAHIKNQDLTSEEIMTHLESGKVVIMLSVEWNDSLSFKIKDDLTIVGISYTEFLKERLKSEGEGADAMQKFDSEIVLTVESLKQLAPNLQQLFA